MKEYESQGSVSSRFSRAPLRRRFFLAGVEKLSQKVDNSVHKKKHEIGALQRRYFMLFSRVSLNKRIIPELF